MKNLYKNGASLSKNNTSNNYNTNSNSIENISNNNYNNHNTSNNILAVAPNNNSHQINFKKYLNQKEVARYLRISVATLTAYRSNGEGPAYIKLGRMIRYDIEDVERWIKENNAYSKKDCDICFTKDYDNFLKNNPSASYTKDYETAITGRLSIKNSKK